MVCVVSTRLFFQWPLSVVVGLNAEIITGVGSCFCAVFFACRYSVKEIVCTEKWKRRVPRRNTFFEFIIKS